MTPVERIKKKTLCNECGQNLRGPKDHDRHMEIVHDTEFSKLLGAYLQEKKERTQIRLHTPHAYFDENDKFYK